MTNLKEHAERELRLIGYDLEEDEGMDKMITENLLELIDAFSKQGHSGFSANYCLDVFCKLARFEPLSPLTGEDDEWEQVGEETWQNKRCSHVFRDGSGSWDMYGNVFVEKDGYEFTNNNSHIYIDFPYTPKTEYVEVE